MGNRKAVLNPDHALVFMALCSVVLPIICFLWGWTKPVIALGGTVCLLFLFARVYQSLKAEFTVSVTEDIKFWWTALAFIGIWCLFSGIGGFS